MKITIYTVNDCEFSKQEKEYLKTHNLQFEEKNLESNKEFLTEMLAVSDNFAGTPVTKIDKDDGQSVVLKGFTQSEFDETLGYKTEKATETKDTTIQPVSTPTNLEPDLTATPPPAPTPPVVSPPPVTDILNQQPVEVSPSPTTPTLDVSSVPTTPPSVIEPPTQLTQDPSQPPATTVQEPTPPAPTPVIEPPKPVEDPKLASVLSNLQNMSGDSTTTATTAPTPSSNMPSIPDPKFT